MSELNIERELSEIRKKVMSLRRQGWAIDEVKLIVSESFREELIHFVKACLTPPPYNSDEQEKWEGISLVVDEPALAASNCENWRVVPVNDKPGA